MGGLNPLPACRPVAVVMLLGLLLVRPATAMQMMTEELPPYSFQSGNKVEGLSIDLVDALFKRADMRYEIRVVPLKRALQTVDRSNDACIFPLERTQEREAQYTWISPLLITRNAFYSLPDSGLVIRSLKDAQDLSVGIYAGSALNEYLATFDYTGLQVVREELLNARKLGRKRIDLWATDSVSGHYFARRAGINGIREQFTFLTTLRGIACNPAVAPNVVRALRQELREMHAEGVVKQIMDSYRFQR